MSDDGYYYDSPDEDFNDILYDADPAPDLADDLAEHVAQSPVWQDDPVGELNPYFSDWEYYSDDYYDDDPNVLQNKTADGTGDRKPTSKGTGRGRKRKLSEALESSESHKAELQSLTNCLRGTVWATGSPDRVVEYKPGQQQKIALKLSSGVMQAAYSYTRGFGKRKLNREESWANNLGLDEMGLQPQRRSSLQQEADENEEELDPEGSEDDDDDDDDDLVAARHYAERTGLDHADGMGDDVIVEVDAPDNEDYTNKPRRRKRQKLQGDGYSIGDAVLPLEQDSVDDVMNDSARPERNRTKKNATAQEPAIHVDKSQPRESSPTNASGKRKREAEDTPITNTSNGRAAKRIASARIAKASATDKEDLPTTRTTRSKKK